MIGRLDAVTTVPSTGMALVKWLLELSAPARKGAVPEISERAAARCPGKDLRFQATKISSTDEVPVEFCFIAAGPRRLAIDFHSL